MDNSSRYHAMFSGTMGKEYEMLFLVCPLAAKMSQLVGDAVADYSKTHSEKINVVELGGGTGITTHAILSVTDNAVVTSIDNEPTMQAQAQQNLHSWEQAGRLVFSGNDALSALQVLESNSVDVVASAYTLHNFSDNYRAQVISEIFRVLKRGGQFINGDRYGLDDISAHTLAIQHEVTGYFKVFTAQNRLDLLEQWIVHLFSDESENHVMRESFSLQQLAQAGFIHINLMHRAEVNALVTAVKP
jgi:ubiquinone/menaquinone biosynthesis C-methylase UbiE